MSTAKSSRKPGRPRNEAARLRILETTAGILCTKGYRAATMKSIALSAGVGKQTLYRWWRNRADLLMEALLHYAEEKTVVSREAPALREFLSATFTAIDRETGVLLRGLIAESIVDEEFAGTFFEQFIRQRQKRLELELGKLAKRKRLNKRKISFLVDVIFGTMWYRLIFQHRLLDTSLVDELFSVAEHVLLASSPMERG